MLHHVDAYGTPLAHVWPAYPSYYRIARFDPEIILEPLNLPGGDFVLKIANFDGIVENIAAIEELLKRGSY
ncbi:Uncharacterised protein [uncultured archaeon]|nr:Uncharacterised protein [uncultured archaeon]